MMRGVACLYTVIMTVLNAVYYAHHNPTPSLWFASYNNILQIFITIYFTLMFMLTGVEVLTFPFPSSSTMIEREADYFPDTTTNSNNNNSNYNNNNYNNNSNNNSRRSSGPLTLGTISSVNSTRILSDFRVGGNRSSPDGSPQVSNSHHLAAPSISPQYSSYSRISRRSAATGRSQQQQQQHQFHVLILSRWCKLGWVIRNIVSTSTLVSVVIYWSYLHSHNQKLDQMNLLNYITIDSNGINLFLIMIDLLASNTPFRLLHFIHPLIFTILYIIFNYLYSTTVSNVYSQIDWEASPLQAIGMFSIVLVLVVVAHLMLFLLHCCIVCVDAKTKIGFFITFFCLLFVFAILFTLVI